jgi:disulfide oxidoreductase YuzD
MSRSGIVTVRVFGVPTANGCDCGTQSSTWREATEWIGRSLKGHFGEQIRVEYYDLFTEAPDAFPGVLELVARGEAQPPLVFVGDELLSSGGRISGPAIRRRLEATGLEARK